MINEFFNMIRLIFTAGWKALLLGKDEAEKFLREKVKPAGIKYLWLIVIGFALTFIPSFLALVISYETGNVWLAMIGGLWRAFWSIPFLFLLFPILVAFRIAYGGIKDSVRWTLNFIGGSIIMELFITLMFMIMLEKLRAQPQLLPYLIISSMIICLVFAKFFRPKLIGSVALMIFIGIIASFLFPYKSGDLTKGIGEWDVQPLKPVSKVCSEIRGEGLYFRDGSNRFYYDIYRGEIKLFTQSGTSPFRKNEKVKPLNEEELDLYCKQEEKLVQILSPQRIAEIPLEPVPPGGMMKPGISEEEKSTLPSKPPDLIVRAVPPEIKATRPEEAMPRPKPAEPKPNPYVVSSIGQKVSYVILITDVTGSSILEDGDIAARRLREKGISASASVLNANFVRDGIFAKVFAGDASKISEYDFSRYADYLVLGKRSAKASVEALGSGKSYSGDARIDFCVISTAGGMQRCDIASGIGVDFNTRGAEQNSISSAISKLVEKIS